MVVVVVGSPLAMALTSAVFNHVLRLDLKTFTWTLVDNYGDIPSVRMGECPRGLADGR